MHHNINQNALTVQGPQKLLENNKSPPASIIIFYVKYGNF